MLELIVIAFLIVLGVFSICKPQTCWEWQHRHAEKAGEAPRWYLISTRISGVIMCIAALIIVIALLFG